MSSSNDPQNYYQQGQYQQQNPQYIYQMQGAQQVSPQYAANHQEFFKQYSQLNSQPPMLQSFNPNNKPQQMAPGWQYLAHNQQGQPMQGQGNPYRGQQMMNPQGFQVHQMLQSSDSQKYIDQSVPYHEGQQQGQGQQYYEQGQEQQQQGWSNKFFEIFQRYQWAYDRFEQLREMYSYLHNKLQTVDSQDDWNQFKSYHEQLYEKFEQMQYEMNTVMSENQRLMEAKFDGKNQNANWQERYKELLGNFKALQQQSHQRIKQSNHNQDQQRENEIKQFNELKDEYMKIYNEMQSAQQHIEGLSNENGKYQEIIESLQKTLTSLEQNNAMLQRQLASKPSISRQDYDKFNAVIDERDGQIRKLKKQLVLKDNQIYSRIEEQMKYKNQQINNLKAFIEKMQGQLKSSFSQDVNKIISMKSDEIAQYRKLLKSNQEQFESKLRQRQEEIIHEYEDKLNTLSTQLKQLQQRETEGNPLADVKLASYEKKVAYYQQQIQNINDMLNKKNQQINRLRGLTYQLQGLKILKNEKVKLQEVNETISANLQNKNREVQSLKYQITQLQAKLKEVSQKKNQANAKGYMDEIRDLKEIIASKDREIIKLRQNQQIKEKTINQLQHENEVNREKLITRQKNVEIEREQFRNQMRAKQSRNLDLQRKIRNIQLDFGQSTKNNLLSEINTLRLQNQSKQEIIIKLQNQQIELKGQITHLQRQKKDLDYQARTLKTKSKEQQSIRSDLSRKMETITVDAQSKNKIIRSLENHQENLKSQIEKLQKQIIEAENTLKSKNSVINQLQDKLQNLNDQYSETSRERDALKKQLRRQNDAHERDSRQLKYKLQESEELIKSGKLWSNLELKNNQNQQTIKKLKSDNQILRSELAKTLDGKSTTVHLNSSQINHDNQQQNFLEKRLRDFNHKLDQMMGRKVPSQQNSRINKENEFSSSDRQQIKILKERIVELQQYCTTLQERIGESDTFLKSQSLNGVSIFNQQQKIYNQQLDFHKKRAQQFEERIDGLLKINRDLKCKLQVFLKTNPDSTSSTSFYKNQLQIAEKNVQNLNQKIRKLTDENILLKKQTLQYSTNSFTQYQSRIIQFENTVQQLQRKIRQFQIQKVTTQNEKATLKHTISRLQSNIQILKSNLSEKVTMYESMLQQTKSKFMSYDQDVRSSGSNLGASSRLEMR